MYRQVSQLQRQGQLDEACELAQNILQEGNADANLLRMYGMVLANLIRRDSEKYYFDSALHALQLFSQTPLPEDEVGVYTNLVESLLIFVTHLTERSGYEQRLNRCFDLITTLPIHAAGFLYILLIKRVLKLKGWTRQGEFSYWCGLTHLRTEDYAPFVTTSGDKVMALAEQLSIRIAKYLLETKQTDKIAEFIPQLKDLCQRHPEYIYPPYYLTQLYLLIGDNAQAKATLLPFVRKKSRDFWVWQRMAEVEKNLDNKVTYYAKAIHCGSRKEEMLVSLYEDAAIIMSQANLLPLAKWLIDHTCEIRYRNKWHEPDSLKALIAKPWYATTISKKDEQWLQEQANRAELLTLGKVQSNNTARNNHPRPSKPKNYRGKLKIAPAGFGFVHDERLGDIFVPQELVASHCHGEMVSGCAKEKYDKKKQRMSLVAQTIN